MRPKERRNQGCCGSTESEIVALRRSWRDIFPRKTGTSTKTRKTSKHEELVSPEQPRDETMTKTENETMMLNMNRAP